MTKQRQLGNLGQARTLCVESSDFDTSVLLSCRVGEIGQIYDLGFHLEIESYHTCSSM